MLTRRREGLARALQDQRDLPTSHRTQLLPQQTGSSGQTTRLVSDGCGEAIKRSPCPCPSTSPLRLQVLAKIHSQDHAVPSDVDFSGHEGSAAFDQRYGSIHLKCRRQARRIACCNPRKHSPARQSSSKLSLHQPCLPRRVFGEELPRAPLCVDGCANAFIFFQGDSYG